MSVEERIRPTTAPWRTCCVCQESLLFKSPRDFCVHLRHFHCTKEGGSFVCRYGANGVCPSLPLEGVSDRDYEDHVARDHVASETAVTTGSHASRGAGSQSPEPPSCVPSTAPSVVQDQHRWTMYMSQVNLPAALNDPNNRELDIFSKTWGEAFQFAEVRPSTHLPNITKDHFRKYLRKVAQKHKVHMRANMQAEAAVPSTSRTMDLPTDVFPMLHTRHLAERSRTEIESIPKMFMMGNFSLENPDTFNAVFPWTQNEKSPDQSQHSSSKLLQEKLSHYLDVVEVQIARQISIKSEAFFHAMSSHDKLQEDMAETCQAIKCLREKMAVLQERTVGGPLKILKLAKARANHIHLYNKLKLMATVHQTQPTIQLLLATNEFVGALDLIATTQEVLAQELAGVHSFRHLGSQLSEMGKLIDKMMQEDFVRYITMDLNRPLDADLSVAQEERLVSIVLGMLRQHKFNFIDIYREEASTAIKTILKQTVIEAVAAAEDIDSENNTGSLADQMRLLNYPQWMNLLQAVFDNMLILLTRVKGVVNVMQEVFSAAAGQPQTNQSQPLVNGDVDSPAANQNGHDMDHPSTPTSPSSAPSTPLRVSVSNDLEVMMSAGEFSKASMSLREMMCKICDQAHDRCVKLLNARAKDGFLERLSSSEFVQLSRSIESFVADTEALCGWRSSSLHGCLQGQANKFVNRFHDERKTKLSLILDNERWRQADVPAEFQDLVDHIMCNDGASHDYDRKGVLTLPDKKTDNDKKPHEYLHVNGQKYAVVGTVLMLLKMVVEYCQCVDDMPSSTPDILTRLVELLKMFNSRTCQLILGAGALELVGLKTITTKNLALSSRCLQLALYFLPRVRQHFEERLQNKQTNMLKHFEHIFKDYNDHIEEIANKIVAITEGMLDKQLMKWEVKAPMPSVCFRAICKQMCKLHETIVDLLPPNQVLDLFQRMHNSFKLQLRLQLIRLGVTNDGGPQHGLVMADIAYYTGYIKSLEALDHLEDNMDDIWDKR